jgi:hypothetical protein
MDIYCDLPSTLGKNLHVDDNLVAGYRRSSAAETMVVSELLRGVVENVMLSPNLTILH